MSQPKTLFEIVSDIARTGAQPRPVDVASALLNVKQCQRCGFVECLCGNPVFEQWLATEQSNS